MTCTDGVNIYSFTYGIALAQYWALVKRCVFRYLCTCGMIPHHHVGSGHLELEDQMSGNNLDREMVTVAIAKASGDPLYRGSYGTG